MNQSFNDLIYLCSCAASGTAPDRDRVSGMELSGLYRAAEYQTLTAAAAYALEAAGISDHSFTQAKEKAIRKNLLLDFERKKLSEFMEKEEIWYMPLKGAILKDIYPKAGMRQMSDNDILFDAAFQEKVRRYFEQQGYEVTSFGKGNHDVYEKPPVLNFEMHTSLFSSFHDEKWESYYENIKEKLIITDGTAYGYHFSDEDFYIYITTHEYKHHSGAGTGIRSLLDCFVYLKNKSDSLDWSYIKAECQKLGIAEFERQSRELSLKIFVSGDNELSESDEALLERYLTSGTYGSAENDIKSKITKFSDKTGSTSKISYIIYRLFPDSEHYRAFAPVAWKYKILIPFYLIFRTVRGLTAGRKKIFRELKTIRKESFDERKN